MSLPDCSGYKNRRLYKLKHRSLDYGIYRKAGHVFLGLKSKFGSLILTIEHAGPPSQILEDTLIDLPDNIELVDVLPGSWDKTGTREIPEDSNETRYANSNLDLLLWLKEKTNAG